MSGTLIFYLKHVRRWPGLRFSWLTRRRKPWEDRAHICWAYWKQQKLMCLALLPLRIYSLHSMSEPAMNQTREARNAFLILRIQGGNAKVRISWSSKRSVMAYVCLSQELGRDSAKQFFLLHPCVWCLKAPLCDLVHFYVSSHHSVTQRLFPYSLQLKVPEFQLVEVSDFQKGQVQNWSMITSVRISQKASSDSAPCGRKRRNLVVISNLVNSSYSVDF